MSNITTAYLLALCWGFNIVIDGCCVSDLEHILCWPVHHSADGCFQCLLGLYVQWRLQQIYQHIRLQLVPGSLQIHVRLTVMLCLHIDKTYDTFSSNSCDKLILYWSQISQRLQQTFSSFDDNRLLPPTRRQLTWASRSRADDFWLCQGQGAKYFEWWPGLNLTDMYQRDTSYLHRVCQCQCQLYSA